jgi:hypothetical protein
MPNSPLCRVDATLVRVAAVPAAIAPMPDRSDPQRRLTAAEPDAPIGIASTGA